MSIIYNNQVVAGKYTQQVVADADTVNAGIIKIATEEQINEGTDNTTVVTPFYLAQKQDKISAGDGIVIDNNEISCTINPDEQTIVRKNNGTMQCIGQLTKSNTLKFDWEGTQAEYNVAYLNGIIQPDWYCYITDDESIVDYGDVANQSLSNLKQEGEDRFNNKANIDLDNLSSVGQSKLDIKADKATTLEGYGITDGLNKNQITNCLLEIPQRINLELNNGTLTLKAGSEVIVPNGFEADGVTKKFDYVTILQDEILNALPWEIGEFFVVHGFSANALVKSFTSGDTAPQPINGQWWYDTGNNKIKKADGTSWNEIGCSLPVGIINSSDGASVTSIDQVFNGIGYIGSTVWVDKGVKGLIPSGRNEDETLKNIEFTTNKVITRTFANTVNCDCDFLINATNIYYGVKRDNIYYYDSDKNYNISNGSVISGAVIGFGSIVNGSISLKVNHVFRAVAHNDLTKAVDNLLNKQQITNCILEIPQRIKIELNNGALTLKAGSEVIIPNGFEADGVTPKFNYVTIEEDTSNNFSWMTMPGLLTWRPNNSYFDAVIVDNQFSGDSTPASPREGIVWYDTTTNKVKRHNGTDWSEDNLALPLGYATAKTSGGVECFQVFNGMGYIGFTVWVDKGVKCLIPNGRNQDGTLNNIEYTFDKVVALETNNDPSQDSKLFMQVNDNGVVTHFFNTTLTEGKRKDITSNTNGNFFLTDENRMVYVTNGVPGNTARRCVLANNCYITDNIVRNMEIKLPFKAVDYNDKSAVSGWGMPSNKYIDLTLGAPGATYTAPANGYFILDCPSSSSPFSIWAGCSKNGQLWFDGRANTKGNIQWTSPPCKRGSVMTLYWSNLNTANVAQFRFYYAEGDQ